MSGPPRASTPTLEHTNVAAGNATIGAQIGVLHGDFTYEVHGTEPPERKVTIGIYRLLGGNPREAEPLLGDGIRDGNVETRALYYWALSILGYRSRDQFDANHRANLDDLCGMVPPGSNDTWSQGIRVIRQLVDLLLDIPGGSGGPGGSESTDLDEVLESFDQLDAERSREIRRFLDQILDGVVPGHLHKTNMAEVEQERLAGDRADRAWKFFQPEPAAPKRVAPPRRPPCLTAWLKLVTAFAVAIAAGVSIVPESDGGGMSPLVGLLLLGCGLIGVVHFGLRRRLSLDERDERARRFAVPMVDGREWKPESQGWGYFLGMVVGGAFNRMAPEPGDERSLWDLLTRGYRINLVKDWVETYDDPQIHRRPSKLRWLADQHADQLAQRWDEGHLGDVHQSSAVPYRRYLEIAVSALAAAIGAFLCWWPLWTFGGFVDYAILPLLIAFSARVACDQGCRIYRSAHARTRAEVASDRRFQAEHHAYLEWCEVLSDTPTDIEMAGWLDYDKRYLRARAMELYQVDHTEVIAHIVLCEPTPGAKRSSVLHGQIRHDRYLIRILLMTRGGVRVATFHLDFLTGVERELDRRSFRYDAIASVHVTRTSVQKHHAAAQAVGKPADEDSGHHGRSVYRSVFRIVLLNQEPIEVFLDTDDDDVEEDSEHAGERDRHELIERALDSSGVSGALWMMEAITADGKDWIQAEESRSRLRRLYRAPTTHGNDGSPVGAASG